MANFLIGLVLCLTLARVSQGKTFNYPFLGNASSLATDTRSYDYIIVGGGTAGCPLAATLSQNFSVLVLERGGSPYGNQNISYMQNFLKSLVNDAPGSPAQAFVSTDGVINARARVLGGGSCINGGFYSRASPRYVKNAGWDAKLVNESYPWIEKQIINWPELVPWQVAFKDGLLQVGVLPFNGYTYDHLYGTKVGGTLFHKNGFRNTAADLLSAGNPANLRVLIHASVQRILFDTKGKKPRAIGVVFKDENGNVHQVVLSNRRNSEVILSSGAIGTPQLLILSGIGPLSELTKMEIPRTLRNEFVGKGMSDNPLNTIFIPTKKPVVKSIVQVAGITKLGIYIEAASGFGLSLGGIKRKLDQSDELFRGGYISSKIAAPLSRGYLSLYSTNVDDNPLITFNYFSHPEDLKRCVDGVRIMVRIARSEHFTELTEDKYTMTMLLNMTVQANPNLIPKHSNDTVSLEQFCKDTVATIWHYHGGCRVGEVVDSNYRVLGVDSLRVVDGSIFNESPGTNPQATVMMLGRYMGVKLLREELGPAAGV